MKYYLGKGTEFKKEDCKEYKTIEGALRAAAKDETLVVWEETGKVVGSLTDNVPDGALQTNPDGSVPVFKEDGSPAGTADAATVAEAIEHTGQDDAESGANTEPQEAEDKVIFPLGKMLVTVICEGSLNIRRAASWSNDSICGRATKGQSYYVKEIRVVDGKKMIRTIEDLYISGEPEHVQYKQL